jgi:hypothetical protein
MNVYAGDREEIGTVAGIAAEPNIVAGVAAPGEPAPVEGIRKLRMISSRTRRLVLELLKACAFGYSGPRSETVLPWACAFRLTYLGHPPGDRSF